jgi:hypothetical protein
LGCSRVLEVLEVLEVLKVLEVLGVLDVLEVQGSELTRISVTVWTVRRSGM